MSCCTYRATAGLRTVMSCCSYRATAGLRTVMSCCSYRATAGLRTVMSRCSYRATAGLRTNVMLHLPCYRWSEDCNVMWQSPCYHWSHTPHKSKDCKMPNGQTDTSSSAKLHWTKRLGSGTRRTDGKCLTNYQDFYTKTAPTVLQSGRISSSRLPRMPSLHTKGHTVGTHHPSGKIRANSVIS